MPNIDNLNLEELLSLFEDVSTKLIEDYDYFSVMSVSKGWVNITENGDGSGEVIPFTDLYKDPVELYNATKKYLESQTEHIKEFPQLQAYLGTVVDRQTGRSSSIGSNYILNKLYENR